MKYLLTLTFLMSGFNTGVFASEKNLCQNLFGFSESELDKTIRALAGLRLELYMSIAQNNKLLEREPLEIIYAKKEKAILEFLSQTNIMTRDSFYALLETEIARIQSERLSAKSSSRSEVQKHLDFLNSFDGYTAVFNPVTPGSFMMGPAGQQVAVKLTKPFEMMAFPVTEIIWQVAASFDRQKLGKIKVSLETASALPAVDMIYDWIEVWIEVLNTLSEQDDPRLKTFIKDHDKNYFYRLPTEAEWEYVAQMSKFENENDGIELYSWNKSNTNTIQPVAKKKPLILQGGLFFDMLGNIREIVQDEHEDQLPGGTDPVVKNQTGDRATRGSSHYTEVDKLTHTLRQKLCSTGRLWDVGFRLVREKRKP